MRIHVWGINYSPEVTGIAPCNVALCESLSAAGHSVRMVTSFCYYPAWQKLPNEENLLFRTDDMDGVTVHRCWHYVPKTVTTLKRVFHECSFVLTSFLRQCFLPRPELLVIVSPPLLLGAAGWLLSKIKRTRFVFHVQDLQPDAAAGLGMLKESGLLRALRRLESFAYRKADWVSGITPGMVQSFQAKGVPAEKCVYFPNGVEIPDFWRLPQRGQWRKAHGFGEDEFLVVYSGNIGRKQGLDGLIAAAEAVKNPVVQFVICGEGADLAALKAAAGRLKLPNLRFFPLFPEARYRELLVDADLSVIPQKSGSGGCFFPSKLLTALAFGSPILAVTDSDTELAKAVREGAFGFVVSPGDPAGVARVVEQAATDLPSLREMGRAGSKFVKRFEMTAVLAAFRTRLEALAR